MSDSNVEAPPPVPSGQSGGDGKANGAANMDDSSFAKMLVKREAAKATAAPAKAEISAPSQEESAPPANNTQTDEVSDQTESDAESDGAEGSPEANDEAEVPVLSKESTKLDEKTQASLNRRIGKEVGKTKRALQAAAKAEAERDALKAQLESMRGNHAEPPQSLPEIDNLSALEKHEQEARRTIRWIDAQLDRDDFPAEGIKTEEGVLTKAALKTIRMNARIALEDQIPAQRKFLEDRQAADQKAHEAFPFWNDPESDEYAEAQAAFQANPWLKSIPNYKYVIGVQLLGMKALKEKQEAKKGGKTVKTPPKPMNGQAHVASDASPARVPLGSNQAAISAAQQQLYKKNGASEKDMAAYFKQREILRHS